jgi:hypothetical protein
VTKQPRGARELFLALAAFVLLLTACASTPQASRESDADAKQFVTHPGSSTLYVYRSELDLLREQTVLYIDERLIGSTLPGGYFRIDTVPGRHVLQGIAGDTGRLALETRPGTLYFVEMQVLNGNSHFRLVPDDVGRKRILQCCALLENWAPGQRPLLK